MDSGVHTKKSRLISNGKSDEIFYLIMNYGGCTMKTLIF